MWLSLSNAGTALLAVKQFDAQPAFNFCCRKSRLKCVTLCEIVLEHRNAPHYRSIGRVSPFRCPLSSRGLNEDWMLPMAFLPCAVVGLTLLRPRCRPFLTLQSQSGPCNIRCSFNSVCSWSSNASVCVKHLSHLCANTHGCVHTRLSPHATHDHKPSTHAGERAALKADGAATAGTGMAL